MIHRALLALGIALCASLASANYTVFEVLEGAAEVERLVLKASNSQIVYTRECDECAMLALSVNNQTQFFKGSTPITLTTATGLTGGATVFFDQSERIVSRIVFWQ